MTLKIVVLNPAKSDIEFASTWYENQQAELGKTFKKEIVRAIDKIGEPIRGFRISYKDFSRIFLEKFPYTIYFKTDILENEVIVYAVIHNKQNKESILKFR